ncbi:type I DNA topoisomerase [Clostridium cellulovorans]|uniref:DNA topoisomerase 1 n=1 Tax=Clostridium cellulovorans (strain ATCC 35296 / DSM 3052 / OCM 3 / 743B) TaxID=573061 RepID=D9SKM0_CLOC7|nr:type I DNA topoisomerase [Clostridium cellulovorans]ADL51516.1 DNA topoisomerase I [Clostridium cellulovorans 743B]
MGTNLVIVESPAKAKTIRKYLGKNYVVEASMGHVRDLPKSQTGVDVENNYEPKYITIRGKGELLDKLRKQAKKSEKIYLATDPDREGEAISWHLSKVLKLSETEKCRIEFNEITKTAIKAAIKSPREINMNLVDAQQARRVLDRLVGYGISPILWRKVKWGLSAGRVQSATLRMICERDKKIKEFIPKEYWTIEGIFNSTDDTKNSKEKLNLKLHNFKNEKIEIDTKEKADEILNIIKSGNYTVSKVKKTERIKNPLPPFITSTLQQDAYRKLNFTTKRTMSIAQQLYEGIEIKGKGSVALITYMRTDSVRISDEAQKSALEFINTSYGTEYVPSEPRIYKGKKNIQDAHEAIRPTYIDITPDKIKGDVKDEIYKLYKLIWERFVASQMKSCVLDTVSVTVDNSGYNFKANGSTVKFDGFMKIYSYGTEGDESLTTIPKVQEGEMLSCIQIDGLQHFTEPPARFSEASLVKTLEENGIGRPSTYAPTIATLLSRKYIEREKKTLVPTELGIIVDNIMCEFFNQIVDEEFTANMEERLDDIELGDSDWRKIVNEFFTPVKAEIEKAEIELAKITIEDEVTDIQCEKCGRNMVIKHGKFGDFLACPGYPECENTKPIVEEIDTPCPKCGSKIVVKKSKKGRKFFGCSTYPNCDYVSWYEPSSKKCNQCGSIMLKKYNKTNGNYLECSNSDCKSKEIIQEETE